MPLGRARVSRPRLFRRPAKEEVGLVLVRREFFYVVKYGGKLIRASISHSLALLKNELLAHTEVVFAEEPALEPRRHAVVRRSEGKLNGEVKHLSHIPPQRGQLDCSRNRERKRDTKERPEHQIEPPCLE